MSKGGSHSCVIKDVIELDGTVQQYQRTTCCPSEATRRARTLSNNPSLLNLLFRESDEGDMMT